MFLQSKIMTLAGMRFISWEYYQELVKHEEENGLTTSDAQGVIDAQLMIQNIGVVE